MNIQFAIAETTLGRVLVAQSERGVCAVMIGDDQDVLRHELQTRFPGTTLTGGDAQFDRLVAKVIQFVESPVDGLDVPLDIHGTPFEQSVWRALCEIPAGTTTSYAEIANRLGRPGSARAVGRACATNALAVLIPCHRVVASDGKLTGYRWGIQRKRALLEREAMACGPTRK